MRMRGKGASHMHAREEPRCHPSLTRLWPSNVASYSSDESAGSVTGTRRRISTSLRDPCGVAAPRRGSARTPARLPRCSRRASPPRPGLPGLWSARKWGWRLEMCAPTRGVGSRSRSL